MPTSSSSSSSSSSKRSRDDDGNDRGGKKKHKSNKVKIGKDSNQTNEERQALRTGFRQIENSTKTKLQTDDIKTGDFNATMDNMQGLHRNVRHTSELLLDVRANKLIGDLGIAEFKKYEQGMGVGVDDFLRRVQQVYKNDGIDDEDDGDNSAFSWVDYGRSMGKLLNRVQTCDFMVGPIQRHYDDKKEKVAAARRTKDDGLSKVHAIVPDIIKDTAEEEKSQTDIRVQQLLQLVHKQKEQPHTKPAGGYFELMCNPTSFCQTVENIFDSSFLIKDCRAGFDTEGNNYGGLEFVQTAAPDPNEMSGLKSKQFVMKFTFEDWQNMVDLVGEDAESIIPERDENVR